MTTAYIALGSNLGDRWENLQFAARRLADCGVEIVASSSVYRSSSVETGGEGEFFNAVLRVRAAGDATQFLALCQAIETEAGREKASGGRHRVGPRTLDIDILLWGAEHYTSPVLQVPHPRALHRNFVLQPLLEVLEGGALEKTSHTF